MYIYKIFENIFLHNLIIIIIILVIIVIIIIMCDAAIFIKPKDMAIFAVRWKY